MQADVVCIWIVVFDQQDKGFLCIYSRKLGCVSTGSHKSVDQLQQGSGRGQ